MSLFNIKPLCYFLILLCSLLLISAVEAYDPYPQTPPKVHEYTFHVNHTELAPDGFSRRVWTVNGQFPGPEIHAYVNDTIKVKVINGLDEPTSIHWHGIFQKGTPWFDGAAGMTQCGIPSGESLTYEFIASDSGTYWWHAHYKSQYVDGLFGALIVHDPIDKYLAHYDEEYPVLINWWYHNESSLLLDSLTVPGGDGPEPNSGLINGRSTFNCTLAPPGSKCVSNAPLTKFKFEKGKRYRLRIINTSGDGRMLFSIDKHVLKVIEVDGFRVQPYTTHRIVTSPGQRYSVIVEANQPPANYYLRADFDALDDGVDLDPNVTAIINYYGAPEDKLPTPDPWDYSEILESDLSLRPFYPIPAPYPVGTRITFRVNITEDDKEITHAVVNNVSYVPDLTYSTLDKFFDNYTLSALNGPNQNLISFDKYGEVIEFVIQNDDEELHPFHLHGHKFWIVGAGTGDYIPGKTPLNNTDCPIQRDTSLVLSGGYSVIRIIANNPGAWGFHCHIDWHLAMGMSLQVLELPSILKTYQEPASVKKFCKKK